MDPTMQSGQENYTRPGGGAKNFLVMSIIIALVFFAVGGAVGFFFKAVKDAPLSGKADTVSKLSSKLVVSMVVYGEVVKIDGKNITLSLNNDQMTLNVGANARLYSLGSAKTAGDISQKTIVFEEIKKGDKLNIAVSLSQDGNLVVQSVIVLPSVGAK